MATIFDGREYSLKKKILLKTNVDRLRETGVIPHLATILIGNDKASELYVNLKKKFIEEIGCQVDVYDMRHDMSSDGRHKLNENTRVSEIEILIDSLNTDKTVQGIMIQFPLPQKLSSKKEGLINLIDPNKDVDGLQENSKFLHPTSKAILEVIALAVYETKQEIKTVCVVGASGMVGKPLVKELKKLNYEVIECNSDTKDLELKTASADVVVSATGQANLITSEMVKSEAVVIDVGSPFGDVNPDVSEKTGFITPVPGGVGPVTITCLAENLIIAC